VSLLEAHDPFSQRQESRLEQRLGEEIRHIISTFHRLQLQDLVALGLMYKMLTKINVLCSVCAPNSATCPLDARSIILENSSRIWLWET
jgi:hypothetical protein